MITYKMRAEALTDVISFMELYPVLYYDIHIQLFNGMDPEVTFKTVYQKDYILKRMQEIPDAHVMGQTLEPAEKYTGTRKQNAHF